MDQLKTPLLLALALALLAAPSFPQDLPADEETWTFTPGPEGIELTRLLDILGDQTGASVLYDPASPQIRGRKLELVGKVRIPRARVFQWVRSLLFYHRLVLIPSGPRQGNGWALFDINAPQVTTRPEHVPEEDLADWEDAEGAYIVTTVNLQHLEDTARARNALAQIATRQIGRVNDVPQTRSFVIADFAPVVHAMWRMLKEMDAEAKNAPLPRGTAAQPKAVVREPTPEEKLRGELQAYEMKLVGSRTSHAAQYFLNLIQEIRAKLQKAEAGG